MDIHKFRQELAFLFDTTAKNAVIYFAVQSANEMLLKKADIEETVQGELLDGFMKYLKDEIADNEDLSLLNLSYADERKNVLYRYDFDDEIKGLGVIDNALEDGDIDYFNKESGLHDVYAIVVLIGNCDKKICLYKKVYSVNLIKKTRFGFLKGTTRRLDRLDKDLLLVSPSFDLMKVGSSLLIKNIKVLESFFGFFEAVKDRASSCISEIEKIGIVSDVEILRERLDDITLARKLAKITKKSPVLSRQIPNEDIINFTNTHPFLVGVFKYSDEGKIILSSKKTINMFIKLLNDDYLHSELTKLDYASLAKDSVEEETDIADELH